MRLPSGWRLMDSSCCSARSLVGSYVLEFFGITLPVLRIAGGVVVTAFGWTLLQRGQELGN
jgi:small neutral amino acid transporter SnatA (MarC family)